MGPSPPITLEPADVRRIARLARLALTDEEVERLVPQLRRILDYFGQLEQVETAGVEPQYHPLPIVQALRADVPVAGLTSQEALANAPEQRDGMFCVPAVIDRGEGATA